jgi:hypothetical protein
LAKIYSTFLVRRFVVKTVAGTKLREEGDLKLLRRTNHAYDEDWLQDQVFHTKLTPVFTDNSPTTSRRHIRPLGGPIWQLDTGEYA